LTRPIDDLAAADVGRKKLGPPLDHVESDDRAAGQAQQCEPSNAEHRTRNLGGPDAVDHEPFDAQRPGRGIAVLAERSAGAGLVPVDEREVSLPRREERRERAEGGAGPAHDHERRIASVGAA
jgi:hypothetical protein